MNNEIVLLYQHGGMGNNCWRVPVSDSQLLDYVEMESRAEIITLIAKMATGWCNGEYLGKVVFFVSRLSDSGLERTYWRTF